MNETDVASLIKDMKQYADEFHPDLDYASAFGERVRALGEQELLTHLFRTRVDSQLRLVLDKLRFAWRDLSFDAWMRILEDVSDDRRFVYQFLMFASDTLALDIRRLPSSHPNVQLELQSGAFRTGRPRPPSRALRADLGDHFDYEGMWRRLASEGAPMQPLPDGA